MPLDSVRLAQFAVPFPCHICGSENTLAATLCQHCSAPMSIAHQVRETGIAPHVVTVLGSSGAGKTVYLGTLLDMLSRERAPLQLTSRGAYSLSLQQNTMSALARCEFPSKTPSEADCWNWAHCQVRDPADRRPIELLVPDMAGEAMQTEADHPLTFPVIRQLLGRSEGVMVMIDALEAGTGGSSQEFLVMKMLSYLSQLRTDRRRKKPDTRPVALILTKADQCEDCFEDPSGFARRRLPGLWKLCQQHLQNCHYFASGVAGCCAWQVEFGRQRVRVPLRLEPRGIVEPFVWLVRHLQK